MQHLQKEGNQSLPTSPLPFHPKNYLSTICLGFEEKTALPMQAVPQTEKINLAMGFDAGYAIHSLTTLTSIFGTTKTPQNLEIYLLHADKLPQELKDKFFQIAPSSQQIHFIEVSNTLVKSLPITNNHITLAAYYRLLLPELIKESKILWIDGDTIVCEDIAHLWQEDLTNFPLAAVPDLAEKQEKKRLSAFYRTIEKDVAEIYVNSGVTLLNLDLIREIYPNFLGACQDFIETYPDIIQLEDQDLLNLLFVGKIKALPLKWNLYSSFYFRPRYLHYFSEQEVAEALLHPSLIHYASPWNKPWKAGVRAKTKALYWHWRSKAGLPPRTFKEWIAKRGAPCHYYEKKDRNILRTPFGAFPWVKISARNLKPHLGNWQGIFLTNNQISTNDKK